MLRPDLLHYYRHHIPVTLFRNGEEMELLQLKEKLCFQNSTTDGIVGDNPNGDHVVVMEEWFDSEAYDDIIARWPYPKTAHKFPKGWVEARRLCIAVLSDQHTCILYINRDAYTDELMIARVNR